MTSPDQTADRTRDAQFPRFRQKAKELCDHWQKRAESAEAEIETLRQENEHWQSRAEERGLEAEKWFRERGAALERADAAEAAITAAQAENARLRRRATMLEKSAGFATDDVARLDDENKRLRGALTEAQDENARLREALEPFAAVADDFDADGRELADTDGIYANTAGDFRRARAALSADMPAGGGEPVAVPAPAPDWEKAVECATAGCDEKASIYFQSGDVGSYYCTACWLRVQALPHLGVREG